MMTSKVILLQVPAVNHKLRCELQSSFQLDFACFNMLECYFSEQYKYYLLFFFQVATLEMNCCYYPCVLECICIYIYLYGIYIYVYIYVYGMTSVRVLVVVTLGVCTFKLLKQGTIRKMKSCVGKWQRNITCSWLESCFSIARCFFMFLWPIFNVKEGIIRRNVFRFQGSHSVCTS